MREPATAESALEVVVEEPRLSRWLRTAWSLMRRKPLGAFGFFILLIMVIGAIIAPVASPYPYREMHPEDSLKPPSRQYLMGTDSLGRDQFSRIMWGARISLYVGLLSVGIGTVAATVLGVISGYFGGTIDSILQRIVDAIIAFPNLILLLVIMAVLGASLNNVVIALAFGITFSQTRIVRSAALALKETMYIEAARVLGASHRRIIFRHITPNVIPVAITLATLSLGGAILAEASLSFLGLGVPPPHPSWGSMLSGQARQWMLRAPWMAIFPGLALSLAVYAFNMLGDAMRDVLDPRLRGTR